MGDHAANNQLIFRTRLKCAEDLLTGLFISVDTELHVIIIENV